MDNGHKTGNGVSTAICGTAPVPAEEIEAISLAMSLASSPRGKETSICSSAEASFGRANW